MRNSPTLSSSSATPPASFTSKFSSALKTLTKSPGSNRKQQQRAANDFVFVPNVPNLPPNYQPKSILKHPQNVQPYSECVKNHAAPATRMAPSTSSSTVASSAPSSSTISSNLTSAFDWDAASSNGTYSSPDSSPESVKRSFERTTSPPHIFFGDRSCAAAGISPLLNSSSPQAQSSPPFDSALEAAAAGPSSACLDRLPSQTANAQISRLPTMRFDDLHSFIADLEKQLHATDGDALPSDNGSSRISTDSAAPDAKMLPRQKRVSSLRPLKLVERRPTRSEDGLDSPRCASEYSTPPMLSPAIFSPRLDNTDGPAHFRNCTPPIATPEVTVQPPTPVLDSNGFPITVPAHHLNRPVAGRPKSAAPQVQAASNRLPRINRIPKRPAPQQAILSPAAVIFGSDGSRTPPLSPASSDSSIAVIQDPMNAVAPIADSHSEASTEVDGEEQIASMLDQLHQPLTSIGSDPASDPQQSYYQPLSQEDPRSQLTDFNLRLHTATHQAQRHHLMTSAATSSSSRQPVQPFVRFRDDAMSGGMGHCVGDSGDLGLAIVADEDEEDDDELGEDAWNSKFSSQQQSRRKKAESLWDLDSAVIVMGEREVLEYSGETSAIGVAL